MTGKRPAPRGYLLAVDTSSEILGVGLLPRYRPPEGGDRSSRSPEELTTESTDIATMEVDAGLHHVEQLVPTVEALMARRNAAPDALLGLIAAKGPGSFTGLRIAVSLLKGMSGVTGAPLALVPTLEAHALPYSRRGGLICSALDARKGRYYVQFFRGGSYLTPALDLSPAESVDRTASLLLPGEEALLVGPDAGSLLQKYEERITDLRITVAGAYRRSAVRGLLVAGERMLREGRHLPDDGGPLYLRGSEAVFPPRR